MDVFQSRGVIQHHPSPPVRLCNGIRICYNQRARAFGIGLSKPRHQIPRQERDKRSRVKITSMVLDERGSSTLVIGLDGATFDLILPMAARGELPTFARLIADGAWGPLRSTVPPVSPQAWSSFLTGVWPGQHGIFGFQSTPKGRFYRRPLLSARDIQAPTLLHIAGQTGARVTSFGVPMTYPPPAVNGVVIPEQHGPPLSHPPNLWDEMVAAVGDPRDLATHIPCLFTNDKRGYVARQHELLEVQRQAAHWILDRDPYNLAIVAFMVADRMSHFLWAHMDREHPSHLPEWADQLGDALPHLYRRLDRIVGELWDRVAPEGTVLVMSDHGFGPLHKRFYINRWLQEQGMLAFRPVTHRIASLKYPWPLLRLFNGIARRVGLPHVALPIGHWEGPVDPQLYDPRVFIDTSLLIDWSCTRAYGGGSEHGIFVNLKGREPLGTVSPGTEYDRLRHTLRESLLGICDPESKQPVVEQVWFREELYQGPALRRAPDLVVALEGHQYDLAQELFSSQVIGPALHRTGNHRPQGICLVAGPGVRKGASLDEAAIVDLAPTILHLLGIPVPLSMEGRVLLEALIPERSPARTVHGDALSGGEDKADEAELSPNDAAAVEAHLRSLGYIG